MADEKDNEDNIDRLAATSSLAIPYVTRDSVDRHQHCRPVPIGPSRVPHQAATGRCHCHVYRRQVRGDPRP
jgi:hypothetical protein